MESATSRDGKPKSSLKLESAGNLIRNNSRISVSKSFLTLRWSTAEATDAMKSAGLTKKELIVKHLIPYLKATKTTCIAYQGVITQKFEGPDHKAQLDALALVGRLLGMFPEGR